MSDESKQDVFRPRRSFNPRDISMSNLMLGFKNDIKAETIDKYGNVVYKDNAGNIKLQSAEDTEKNIVPDISYQTDYNVEITESSDGVKTAFISSLNDKVINQIVTHKKMTEQLTDGSDKKIQIEQFDEIPNLPRGKIRKIGSLEESVDFDVRIRNSNFSKIAKQYIENKESQNQSIEKQKSGIKISCANCEYDQISLEMNFCPNCGNKF
jgi:hypothetical protein